MPTRQLHQPRIARIGANPLKASRKFVSFVAKIVLALTVSACSTQTTAIHLPQTNQASLPIKAAVVQAATSTPTPAQNSQPSLQRLYVLVAPFPTVSDGVT